MPKESKYAAKLRELGFILQDEMLSPEEVHQADALFKKETGRSTKMPRAKRREYLAKKLIPGFLCFRDMDNQERTYALDELGNTWIAKGSINLTFLDFHDGVKDYAGFAIPIERKLN
jgi:hypothetical protein